MSKKKILFFLLLFFIFFIVYKSWFLPGLITAGDLWSYSKATYETRPLFLYAWDLASAAGMGGFVGSLLWIYLNFGLSITIFGKFLGLDWIIVERVFYLFPFIFISIFSSYKLYSEVLSKNVFSFFSIFIFCFNTYILMVVGGGQVAGIAIAYALSPLVIYYFIKIFNSLDKQKIKIIGFSIVASLLLSLQIIFDLRIAYVTLFAILLLWVLKVLENRNKKYFIKSILFIFLVPAFLTFLLNAFWIIPTIVSQKNPIEQFGLAYSSLEAVRFFSFANFENTLSLLHPNWPENIFGKVGFMKPEFLILPILAFSSLLFVRKTKDLRLKTYVLFFALLGLIGAFLAKGANEPFGGVYLWLFDNFPGFIMFRDPTKWYTLVALSYSILIPFSVWNIYGLLSSKFKVQSSKVQFKIKNYIPNLFLILTSLFLILLIRPAIFGQLGGTFKTTEIPSDYVKLEKFLSSQSNFSRTLWIPAIQRFGFYSNFHPAIPAQNLFNTVDYSQILKNLRMPEAEVFLQETGVRYVIVPYDSQGEIYLKDRKYNNEIYQKTINEVKKIPYLKQVGGFGKIAVFEVSNPKDHFWTSSESLDLKYQYLSPVEYKLEVKNAKIGDRIIFSESYDASWIAQSLKFKVQSLKFNNRFNSFTLKDSGDYSLIVYYYPQILVNIGMVISGLTLVLILGALIYFKKRKI